MATYSVYIPILKSLFPYLNKYWGFEYTDIAFELLEIQERLSVVNIKDLSQIEFPIGHPYLRSKYIPFENYELELIEDKIREFCHIMQCLGAKEININSFNNSASDRSGSTGRNIKGGASYKVVSGEGEYNKEAQGQLIDEISRSISLHQAFTPVCQPYLPEGWSGIRTNRPGKESITRGFMVPWRSMRNG